MKGALSGLLTAFDGLRRGISRKFYGLECPFCHAFRNRFNAWKFDQPVFTEHSIVGGGSRANCFCPVCGSKDRERLIYLYLSRRTDVFRRKLKLLHFAPERRLQTVLRPASNIGYLTADLNEEKALLSIDVTQIPLPAGWADAVICNHVLEHVPDDARALSEIFRVLKPNGWAILQVPLAPGLPQTFEDQSIRSPEERARKFGQDDHLRLYGADYPLRLKAAGFQVEEFKWWMNPGEFGGPRNRYALIQNETLYVCRKP